jgi:hypothetical protein
VTQLTWLPYNNSTTKRPDHATAHTRGRCVPFYNKHPINDVNMRQIILLLLTLILMYSCKEEFYYGTSISIKNELIDTIKVILYPREETFHFMEELTIDPDFNQSLYERKRTDLNILTLMSNVFDSILIYKGNGFFMKFSPDSSFNCNFNPYKDLSIWESEIIEGDMPTNFTNTHTITENFYFRISGANIISK